MHTKSRHDRNLNETCVSISGKVIYSLNKIKGFSAGLPSAGAVVFAFFAFHVVKRNQKKTGDPGA
jgi:hypothetical protein